MRRRRLKEEVYRNERGAVRTKRVTNEKRRG